MLAVSLVLGGAQTVVPGATINVSSDATLGQSEMSVVINPTNPLNLVGFSHRLAAPIDMDVYRSTDGGTTWSTTRIDNTDDGLGAVGNRFDPAVAFDNNGTLYIAYGYRGSAAAPLRPSLVVAAASTDGGSTFVNFRTLDSQADILTADVTDTDVPGVDRWTLTTGRDPNSGLQAAYVTYSQNVLEGGSRDQRVVICGTRDGGANWTTPLIINDGSIAGLSNGGLGAAPVVSFGGEVFVTWWDTGTSLIGDRDRDGLWANVFNFGTDLTIRTDSGFVNVGNGTIAGPPSQPERGARFSPSLAINQFNRDLYLTCHRRSSGNDIDILFGRSSDFGDTWNWTLVDGGTGTEFNPWIAWDIDSGALGIAYYSTEGDQATGNDDVRPRMALSTDNGNTWTRTFLSAQTSNEAGGYTGDYLEYIGFAFRDGTAHCLWASRYMGGGTDLDAFTTRVSLDSATNNNVLRIAGIGGAPDDAIVIRRSPVNANFIEVFEDNVRIYTGLLASIDSITIETGSGVHTFGFDNLPAIPVNILGNVGVDTVFISSLSGVSGLTFTGGDNHDTLVLGTGAFDTDTITSPVTFNGGNGNDTLYMGSGNADAIAANVVFDGGANANSIVYNDTSPLYREIYNVTSSSITRTGLSVPRVLIYGNVGNTITLNCGASGDTVTIGNGIVATVFANGNSGNDNFTKGGGILAGSSPSDFNGGPGFDRITFDDHLSGLNTIFDIIPGEVIFVGFTSGFESVGILAGSGNNEITFRGDHYQEFNIDAGGGQDTITFGYTAIANFANAVTVNGGAGNDNFIWLNASNTWSNFSTIGGLPGLGTYPFVLDGGTGFNSLSIDDTARGAAQYSLSDTRLYEVEADFLSFGRDFGYDNMSAIGITCSNSPNVFSVTGVSTDIDLGNQVTINLNGGADTAFVYPRNAAGNLAINGNIGIIGGTEIDTFTIHDVASALPINYVFSNPFGGGTQNIFGLGTQGGLGTAGIENLTVNAGSGNDTFAINQYKSGTGLTLNGGLGDDVCDFGNNDLATNVTSLASFLFNGMEDTDTFNLRNATPNNSWTYTATGNTTLQSTRTAPTPYFVTLEYFNTEQKAVYAGPAADTFNITSFASGELSFHGAGGDDVMNLPTSSELIGRRVNFFGDAGALNRITQTTNSKPVSTTLHVSQNSIGAFPGDTFFAPGGSVFFDLVQSIQLRAGDSADTVYVQPNAVAAISIIGGNPPAATGDILNLALAAAISPNITGTAANGSVTSSNLKTLSYSGFETGPIIDAVAPAVLAADINLNGIAIARSATHRQAVEVHFSEGLGLFGLPSLQLTNLTTGQAVPQANIALEFDSTTNVAHFTFPGYLYGALPDGNYRGVVVAAQTTDTFGNALTVDVPFAFFTLAGDADHDRDVDVNDLGILPTSWQQSGMTFSLGDFDYSGTVDANDLGILASRWEQSLAPPAAPAITSPHRAKTPISSSRRVADQVLLHSSPDDREIVLFSALVQSRSR